MMKELAFLCIVLHLSFSHALPTKSEKRVTEFSTNTELAQKLRDVLIPNANTLLEIDLLKDFYPEYQRHVIRKRNAGEPAPEGSSKRRRKRRRRRRKKVSSGTGGSLGPEPSRGTDVPAESQLFSSSIDGPINPPVDNVLDPSEGRRKRRRKKKERPVEPAPVIEEQPVLSEMGKGDTDGLLRAKELQAKHIQTDMMNANRLKADRIKADKVQAGDVIVTAGKKKSRRRRPKMEEFVQPGPIYERAGTQRLNSVIDSFSPEPQSLGLMGQPTYPERNLGIPQFEQLATLGRTIPVVPQTEQLFSVRRKSIPRRRQLTRVSSRRRTKLQNLPHPDVPSFVDPLLPIRQTEPLHEFSSRAVLKEYANTPKLSEYVAESVPFQTDFKRPRSYRTFVENVPTKQQFDPSTEFHLFDKPTVQMNGGGENVGVDGTAKTYISNKDPWYFR